MEDGILLSLVHQHDASQSKASVSLCHKTMQLVLDDAPADVLSDLANMRELDMTINYRRTLNEMTVCYDR